MDTTFTGPAQVFVGGERVEGLTDVRIDGRLVQGIVRVGGYAAELGDYFAAYASSLDRNVELALDRSDSIPPGTLRLILTRPGGVVTQREARYVRAAVATAARYAVPMGIRVEVRVRNPPESMQPWIDAVNADLDAERAAQPDREAALRARLAAWKATAAPCDPSP